MRSIDAHSISLFRQVADSASFARAAEHVHMDPTALSRRIAKLEHSLGTRLLIRNRNGIALTPAGRRLYERALTLERLLSAIANDLRGEGQHIAGELSLAFNPSSMLSFAPHFLAHMRQRWPDLHLRLVEASSPQAVDLVARNVVDLGVGSTTPLGAGIHRTELLRDTLTLLLPVNHILASQPRASFRASLAYPYVICHTGAGLDTVLIRQARQLGVRFPESIVVNSYDFVFKMVEAGMGLSVVPALVMHGFPGSPRIVQRPLTQAWARRSLWMYSAWAKPPDALTSLVSREMVDYCATYANGSDAN